MGQIYVLYHDNVSNAMHLKKCTWCNMKIKIPKSQILRHLIYSPSRGTATNGCYCTVLGCTVGVISLTGVESRFPRRTPRPLYTGKLQYKNYSCVGMLPLKNPLLVTTKSATSNAYNATKLVLHVSAYFQYVSHTAPCT